jgi:hypothetical protein
MKDDKKKLIVVGALALLIVCVGVFQFIAGGTPPPAPAATAKKEAPKVTTPVEPIEEVKNPMYVANLSPRDPFVAPASVTQDATKPPTPAPPVAQPQVRQQPLPSGLIYKGGDFGSGGGSTAPVLVAVPEPQFTFRLSGVMLGAKPMAVFTDAQGNQRLILLGGSLDADSKVISIDRDAVTVRFHGKTLRLTVEGNPNAK